jgi:aryl-alcohol dehydrogenase-like predicted oxidoreductase
MQYRALGKTGFNISEISLGTWQVGGKWGEEFDHRLADDIISASIDAGINFIDTADVYGNGESEQAVGRVVRTRQEYIYVATKCGRQLQPHTDAQYTPAVLRAFVEDSLQRMGIEVIDLIQLHCPPTAVYYRPEIFDLFEQLKKEGKIRSLGVSVEKVEEALKAMEYDNVDTVQIIFNIFRQRPAELFFEQAKKKNIGVIVRVPLASGLLSGKFDENSQFASGDHRQYNRDGSAFDKGETFSGVNFQKGLEAVEMLKEKFLGIPLVQLALRWILQFEAVSCVIPGASSVAQALQNIEASGAAPLTTADMQQIAELYDRNIKQDVHHLW